MLKAIRYFHTLHNYLIKPNLTLMPNTVVFLGAGASRAFGYPVVKEILPLIVKGIHEESLFLSISNKENRAIYTGLLKQLLINLSPGLKDGIERNEPKEDWPLVTDLLSLGSHIANAHSDIVDWNFDLAILQLDKKSPLSHRLHLNDLLSLLDVAIVEVIQKNGKVKGNVIENLIDWIKQKNKPINRGTPSKDFVSVITTNYDFSFEWNALNRANT